LKEDENILIGDKINAMVRRFGESKSALGSRRRLGFWYCWKSCRRNKCIKERMRVIEANPRFTARPSPLDLSTSNLAKKPCHFLGFILRMNYDMVCR
jgi:hypothetical protein